LTARIQLDRHQALRYDYWAGKPVGRSVIESRVLRGGSWNNNQDNARADNRNDNHPDNRNDNNGFRVLWCSHIHHSRSECRQVPLIKVGGMRRRADGWRGHVPSARCLQRRAHPEPRRRPGASPTAPHPRSAAA
jgi:hypothetical protein